MNRSERRARRGHIGCTISDEKEANMPDKQKPDQNQNEDKERENASDDESADLKEREYRGPDGEVHHHTKKYMEQNEDSKKKKEQKEEE
jgi:hypothetical protein